MTKILIPLLLLLASNPGFSQDTDAQNEKMDMLYRRGLAAYQAGDYPSAESFFQQILDIGFRPDAAVYLTYIRKETGDFKGALETLQRYLDQSNANDPELQSYISLKLFLEARIASQQNERSRTLSYIAVALAAMAFLVSLISLLRK